MAKKYRCLSDYIAEKGDAACAAAWRVPRRTVESWRRGERIPMPRHAKSVLGLTPELSWEAMYAAI